ncbi:MAG: DUF58 domain-containing protein [Chloroflexi bacterium]|nr:DUF58 domain-containing protein [Chloroflexota bacterium]
MRVTNWKGLPLPWVSVLQEIPREVTVLEEASHRSIDPGRATIRSDFSLGWYHRITRKYTLRCDRRGYFNFGPSTIRSGDLFGLYTQLTEIEPHGDLTIYPRVLPVIYPRALSRELHGSIRAKRHPLVDTTRPMGTREYLAGDDLRHIHWKASARLGRLQTRVYDVSATPSFVIFLDVRTVPRPRYDARIDLLELGVLTATALANDALENRLSTGVYVNGPSRFNSGLIQVPPSQNPDQFSLILEAMADVGPFEATPISRLLRTQGKGLRWGTAVLVVTAVPDESTTMILTQLQSAGHSVGLVQIGASNGARFASGLPIYSVSDEVDWTELQTITIE